MLENSTSSENTTPAPVKDGGGSGPDSDGLHGQRLNSSGQRWPREETLALLQIRSEMDISFRDISPKGPLWQQVSRSYHLPKLLFSLCSNMFIKDCYFAYIIPK